MTNRDLKKENLKKFEIIIARKRVAPKNRFKIIKIFYFEEKLGDLHEEGYLILRHQS
jgi:hypothetical protein